MPLCNLERIVVPRAGHFVAVDRDAHRDQRRTGYDGWSFAYDPVRRLGAARRISPRPIPMQPEAFSGFVAERAPVKLLDAAFIFGSKALDFRHVRLDLGAVQLYRVVTAAGGREDERRRVAGAAD